MPDLHDRDDQQGQGRPPGPPMRMSRGVLSWVVFILFSLMLVMMVMSNITNRAELTYDQFRKNLIDNNIAKAVIRDDSIVGELKETQEQNQNKHFQVELLPGKMDLTKLMNEDFPKYCPEASVS